MDLLRTAITALALLTAPPQPSPNPTHEPSSKHMLPELAPVAAALAVQLEIADQREIKYVLNDPLNLDGDLQILRERWSKLKNAPPLADHLLFPSRDLCNDFLMANRAYKRTITARKDIDTVNYSYLKTIECETETLYKLWDTVRDAKCEYYYAPIRRSALAQLKEQLGEEAYYQGRVPPPVPLWHFQREE